MKQSQRNLWGPAATPELQRDTLQQIRVQNTRGKERNRWQHSRRRIAAGIKLCSWNRPSSRFLSGLTLFTLENALGRMSWRQRYHVMSCDIEDHLSCDSFALLVYRTKYFAYPFTEYSVETCMSWFLHFCFLYALPDEYAYMHHSQPQSLVSV